MDGRRGLASRCLVLPPTIYLACRRPSPKVAGDSGPSSDLATGVHARNAWELHSACRGRRWEWQRKCGRGGRGSSIRWQQSPTGQSSEAMSTPRTHTADCCPLAWPKIINA